MNTPLSEILLKYQKHIDLHKSEEYKTIIKYRERLLVNKTLKQFERDCPTFFLIVGYAVTLSYHNKMFIENTTNYYAKKSQEHREYVDRFYVKNEVKKEIISRGIPYFRIDEREYYVPIFSRALNYIYSYEQYKLLEAPYDSLKKNFDSSIVDLFEIYNFALFDSNFTRLIKIKKVDNIAAFYHAYFHTLYFINEQGRLEYYLPLFDRYLKHFTTNNIATRLKGVVDAFFAFNKEEMLKELVKNELISERLLYRVIPNKYKNKTI